MVNSRIKNEIPSAWAWILPGLYLAVALYTDHLQPGGTLTPFFVVFGFVVMSLKCRPMQMVPWALAYTVVVSAIFLSPKIYSIFSSIPFEEQPSPRYARTATYWLVCAGFIYLCITVNRLFQSDRELREMLAKMPCPIVASDHNGRILYWNPKLEELLPILSSAKNLYPVSLSYFDLLSHQENQGRTISSYLQRLESGKSFDAIDLSIDGKSVKGTTQLMEWAGKKVLLTIIDDGKPA